ncbi:MAG TPA: NAD(P)/FAD-dependent oxidoreductase [Methylocella sp.]|nr:NAD(P)/FAD-dependent oxidoreductase [Methylocella sp.]
MTVDFDAIVVGAGPCGIAAAHLLRSHGLRALMLDKQSFPRVKPCGGGITIKALERMPWSCAPVIERAVNKLIMGLRTRSSERLEHFETGGHICVFAVREAFDRFNFEKTAEAGVAFEVAPGPLAIEEREDCVLVDTGRAKRTARYLIGADGANSAVRRQLSRAPYFYRGFAIEGLIDYADLGREPVTEFFFGTVKNGYGWLFPKGDHVNAGLYTWDAHVTLGKAQLRAYAQARAGTDRVRNIVGFPLGFGGRDYVQEHERIILAGDAAGFAEPILGEGIHNALKSGQAAASAIIACERGEAASLRAAYRKAAAPVMKDLSRCERLRRFFYSNLEGIGFSTLASPVSKAALTRGFAAGMTTREITNAFFLSPFFRAAMPLGLREFLAMRTAAAGPGRLAL